MRVPGSSSDGVADDTGRLEGEQSEDTLHLNDLGHRQQGHQQVQGLHREALQDE